MNPGVEDTAEQVSVVVAGAVRGGPQTYLLAELEAATDGFSDANKLDEGAFGAVYRGKMRLAPRRGELALVAIKVLKPAAAAAAVPEGAEEWSGASSFHKELAVLSKYRHENLVSLLGSCLGSSNESGGQIPTPAPMPSGTTGSTFKSRLLSTTRTLKKKKQQQQQQQLLQEQQGPLPRQCLVFEFMAGGSLRSRLGSGGGGSQQLPALTAQQRFDVASDVARGLEYLHAFASPPLIHQDVKSDNILLADVSGRLVAKVADFGTARFAPSLLLGGATHHATVNVVGTTPYMPPEYLQCGHVSEKTDTYAFGVVLLELLTGEAPFDRARGEMLSSKMYQPLKDAERGGRGGGAAGVLPPLLDARLGGGGGGKGGGKWPLPRAAALGRIARRCIEMMAAQRCTVAEVLPELDVLAGREAVVRAGRGQEYDPMTGLLVHTGTGGTSGGTSGGGLLGGLFGRSSPSSAAKKKKKKKKQQQQEKEKEEALAQQKVAMAAAAQALIDSTGLPSASGGSSGDAQAGKAGAASCGACPYCGAKLRYRQGVALACFTCKR